MPAKLALLLLALPLAAAAQHVTAAEQNLPTAQDLPNILDKRSELVAFTTRDDAALGSPMLYSDWRPGELLLRGNQRPLAVLLKYDLYRQELRVRRPQGDSVVVALAQVQEFRVLAPAPAWHFVNYPFSPPGAGGTCAEVLVESPRAQLVKYWRKALVKRSAPGASYAADQTVSALAEQTHYYLRWPGDGRFSPLQLKRASLEHALAGYGLALAALQARPGRLSTEADFASVTAALEPLLAEPSR